MERLQKCIVKKTSHQYPAIKISLNASPSTQPLGPNCRCYEIFFMSQTTLLYVRHVAWNMLAQSSWNTSEKKSSHNFQGSGNRLSVGGPSVGAFWRVRGKSEWSYPIGNEVVLDLPKCNHLSPASQKTAFNTPFRELQHWQGMVKLWLMCLYRLFALDTGKGGSPY